MINESDELVRRGEIDIAVRDYGGAGVPVVLLHGGGRNLTDWAAVAARLVPYHRVLAVDFRSHGLSTPCDDGWSLIDATDDVEAVIAHFGLDNPFVVGHSLGGIVATIYGTRHAACRGVVNVDGVGITMPSVFPGPDPEAARQRVRDLIEMMVAAAPTSADPTELLEHETVARRLDALRIQAEQRGEDWSVVGPDAARAFFRHPDGRYQENPSAALYMALAATIMNVDIFAITRAVRCPLLFVGATGPAEPDAAGDDLSDVMRLWRAGVQLEFAQIAREHANISWIGLAGEHMLLLDDPAGLSAALLHFMAESQ